MVTLERGFHRLRSRKKSIEEPLFTNSFTPTTSHTIFVHKDNDTTACGNLLDAKNILFKKEVR